MKRKGFICWSVGEAEEIFSNSFFGSGVYLTLIWDWDIKRVAGCARLRSHLVEYAAGGLWVKRNEKCECKLKQVKG